MIEARAVAFVVDAAPDSITLPGPRAPIPFHAMASMRLRALIPAHVLALGRPVHLVPPRVFAADPTLAAFGDLAAVIVGKLFPIGDLIRNPPVAEGLLARLRSTAARHPLLADLCDHLPAQGAVEGSDVPRGLVAGLGEIARLTVPTAALAAALAPHAQRGISVIEDPYEGPLGAPRGPSADGPVRLAWFGLITAETSRPLVAGLTRIARHGFGRRLVVEIVANPSAAAGVASLARDLAPALEIVMTSWSPDAAQRALAGADAVVLPQDTEAAWARVKSHNRLVEAIRAGRIAIASPIPAYRELSDHAWVGDDLAAGLAWALGHPAEAEARVTTGQSAIERRFAPAAVGRRWSEVIDETGRLPRAGAP